VPRPKPAVIFIFITLFLDIFGIGVIVPVLPKLVEQMSGGNLSSASNAVGWLGALYALMRVPPFPGSRRLIGSIRATARGPGVFWFWTRLPAYGLGADLDLAVRWARHLGFDGGKL